MEPERSNKSPAPAPARFGASPAARPNEFLEVRDALFLSDSPGRDSGVTGGLAFPHPPPFCIVGAPRCGTSSLSKALSRHPDVSFSRPKETHFFLSDRSHLSDEDLRKRYFRYFPGLMPHHLAMGEGSVSYLYDPGAISQALRFDRRTKFIVAVRNPLKMLPSYHDRLLYQLDERETDFEKAWALQEARKSGSNLPKTCRHPRLLAYGDVGRLGYHVERLFAAAGRNRCHVIVFDDLVEDPGKAYLQLLGFLGLENKGPEKLKVGRTKRNARSYRIRTLQRLTVNPPAWLLECLPSKAGIKKFDRLNSLRKQLKRLNALQRPTPTLSDPMRVQLAEHFADDVAHLSELLCRDLSHWLKAKNAVESQQ